MNRREALKKLSVGTALAATAPVVLPSTRVAYAASGDDQTGLVGVPEQYSPLPVSSFPFPDNRNAFRQVSIYPNLGGVTCSNGNAPIITYQWRINSVLFGSPWWDQSFRITEQTNNRADPAGTQLAVTPVSTIGYSGPTAWSPISYATGFLLRKRTDGRENWIPADDSWTLECRVRFYCDGAPEAIEAEYEFSGTGNSSPSVVTNNSWNIVSA